MATTQNVPLPTPDELLDMGLNYAKATANNMLRAGGQVFAHVTVFMRHFDAQTILPVIVAIDHRNNDTAAKRRQALYYAGRVLVRNMRAGVRPDFGIGPDGAKERIELPEMDYQHPLLAIYMMEAWYLETEQIAVMDKRPSQSDKRKEGVILDCFGADARQTVTMAEIRRTKRGKPLPLVFDDKIDAVEVIESNAALFLMGMKEEIVASHRLN